MMRGRYLPVVVSLLFLSLTATSIAFASSPSGYGNSGWRGGIGITFGSPANRIPDIAELGYEMTWGGETTRCAEILNIAVYRYFNGIVEISLKNTAYGYDFSNMEDKEKAASLAFDAWAKAKFGVAGLSKYATVRYNPKGTYGNVSGTMNLESNAPIAQAVVNMYLKWFAENDIRYGGISIDNAGNLPESFLRLLEKAFEKKGKAIATNTAAEKYMRYIDFYGDEDFPFSPKYASEKRADGFEGVFVEFGRRHLAPGELEGYLRAKLFNGIVFFGYTDGGVAAGASHSAYVVRPDVWNPQRRVFRTYVPISRAVFKAGRRKESHAKIAGRSPRTLEKETIEREVLADGKVVETERNIEVPEPCHVVPFDGKVRQFGETAKEGVYLYVGSTDPETVECSADFGMRSDTLVYDEFCGRLLSVERKGEMFLFKTTAGPALVQLANAATLAGNMLDRVIEMLEKQLDQRKMEREVGYRQPLEHWAAFCRGWTLSTNVSRSGACSVLLEGANWKYSRYEYDRRQGVVQFANICQEEPAEITLQVYSKAEDVPASTLTEITDRRQHFMARKGNTYCAHLYLDYEDGNWPEVHTFAFAPGTHDWQQGRITVTPAKPVKTAMVLLELHQPGGKAWFDDVHLSEKAEPERNLLAYPGFEPGEGEFALDPVKSADYEGRIGRLLNSLSSARTVPTSGGIEAIQRQIEEISTWIEDNGLSRYWGYELRDLRDAREKADVCLHLLQSDLP